MYKLVLTTLLYSIVQLSADNCFLLNSNLHFVRNRFRLEPHLKIVEIGNQNNYSVRPTHRALRLFYGVDNVCKLVKLLHLLWVLVKWVKKMSVWRTLLAAGVIAHMISWTLMVMIIMMIIKNYVSNCVFKLKLYSNNNVI